MKFREQRGSLQDSLQTEVELEPTYQALSAHLRRAWAQSPLLLAHLRREPLTVAQEGAEDPRTPQWGTTYTVLLGGQAVGFVSERPHVTARRSVQINFHTSKAADEPAAYAKLVGSEVSIRLDEGHPVYEELIALLSWLEQLKETDEDQSDG